MFSSKTDKWETPQDFFDELNREFGFSLDVCALPGNAKTRRYYTPSQDGLAQPWEGVVFRGNQQKVAQGTTEGKMEGGVEC